jgi:murein DD-endopeptidase MepM/ murein hydrolase activator NlpD
MRRCVLTLALACLVLPASTAHAQKTGGSPTPSRTGGVQTGQAVKAMEPPSKLRAARFSVAPQRVYPGGPAPRITYRVKGTGDAARVRVDILGPRGRVARRLGLGWRDLRRTHRHEWRRAVRTLKPGTYTARLHAETVDGRVLTRSAAAPGRSQLRVTAQPPKPKPKPKPPEPKPVRSGYFPVKGPYSFGGEGSRFGHDRGTHLHQGQDISAAEGTPVLAPKPGVVHHRAYQASGAGHYLVIRGDDGRDYVFMHLRTGSLVVDRGHRVRAGQPIAQVGNTGRSFGAHLHFEIWPNGWYAPGSRPIDPLPELLAWAAGK